MLDANDKRTRARKLRHCFVRRAVINCPKFLNPMAGPTRFRRRKGCRVASRLALGSCRLMDTRLTQMVALLIFAGGTGSALGDLCPAPLLDGTLTIPNTAALQLKASTHGDATLTGPHGAISGLANVTCQSGEFNAMLYGMSDGSLYRCRGIINGQNLTGHCENGSATGEISGRFHPQP